MAPASHLTRLYGAAARLKIRDVAVAHEGDKIVITGLARYALDRDFFWDVVKEIDGWESNVVVDIGVERTDVRGFHTVQPGETLASIAKRHLGESSRQWEILEANRDRMNDPDQISPGQQLLIPPR